MIPRLTSHILQKPRLLKDKYGISFVVRLYQNDEEDYSALTEMYRGFEPKEWGQGLPSRLEQKREEWLRYMVDEGINLLAAIEGKIVGHAALFEMERGISCEYLIFVHQDYQNRGIGQALTQAMKDIAREMGYSQIWLTVEAKRLKAIHVYEKAGFRAVGPVNGESSMMLTLKGRR
jgi:ribosomal protein S18 acetylase RimI-like enzyme